MSIRDVLVTGGAGYIGSHLVDALVAREYRVTVLDNLEPQVHRSGTWPSYANPKAKYVKGDVRDRSVFEPLVLASQAVMHFAPGEYRPKQVSISVRDVNRAAPRSGWTASSQEAQGRESARVLVACTRRRVRCETMAGRAPIRPEQQLPHETGSSLPPWGTHVSHPDAGRQGAYRRQLYSMTKYPRKKGPDHRKDLGIPSVARVIQRLRPSQRLSNPYRASRHLVEPAVEWKQRCLRGRRPAARLSVDSRVVDCRILSSRRTGR